MPKPRIMYLESKAAGLSGGEARIGRVTYSKSGQAIRYGDRTFRKIPGGGAKANYYDEASGDEFWISGPKKNGADRLYGERIPVFIDDDIREEYGIEIREQPDEKTRKTT